MVTVIIPCYNYARFLPDAVESALFQASPELDVEVFVVDDGSTDETSQVAARYGDRIRYHYQENAGLSAARNTGMAQARHDLVLFLDADDALLPGALEALLEARHRADPTPAVLASRYLPVDEEMRLLWPERPESTNAISFISARDLVLRNRFAPSVLADRRNLLRIGGFDNKLWASEDRDLWIRVAARHPVALFDQFTLLKRDHGACMSRAASRQTAAIERLLEKAFSEPDLSVSAQDRHRARAVCHLQSALMYADAGDHSQALTRIVKSFLSSPFRNPDEDDFPRFSRLRCLLGCLRKNVFRPQRKID